MDLRLGLQDAQNHTRKVLTVPIRWQTNWLAMNNKCVRLSLQSLTRLVTGPLNNPHHKSDTRFHILTAFTQELINGDITPARTDGYTVSHDRQRQ